MRAIDADKMKADLLTVDPQFETMIQWCITVLDAQPTIEPRKKGKWIDDEGNTVTDKYCAICSACGEWSEYLTAYCPNCGAEMREPEDIPMEYFESGGR